MLGWLDTRLPRITIYSYAIMIIIASMVNYGETIISNRIRIILIAIFLAIFVLIMVALYVTYTDVGGILIEGVQGRYFIPPALLLLALDVRKLKIKYFNYICVTYVIFALTTTSFVLLNRYYGI